MPNWCEGNLKVRGTKENIIKFLTDGFTPVTFFGASDAVAEIELDDWEFNRKIPEGCTGFYLNGTRRNFVESNLQFYFEGDEEEIATLHDFKAAWGISANELAEVSNNYNIDLKIYAYERGMEFNQDIEIHKGEIIKNDEIKFDDYRWECPESHLGG